MSEGLRVLGTILALPLAAIAFGVCIVYLEDWIRDH